MTTVKITARIFFIFFHLSANIFVIHVPVPAFAFKSDNDLNQKNNTKTYFLKVHFFSAKVNYFFGSLLKKIC